VYGPGEILGAGQWRGTEATVWRNVVPTFVYRALKGMPLQLENGGVATRDFIFVGDIVDGLLRCASRGVPGDVYNLASGVETSIRELAVTVNELCGEQARIMDVSRRTWDRSGRRFGSPVKSKRELDFVARTDLRYGLAQTVEWTRTNLQLIDRCVHKHDRQMEELGAPVPA
jgi:nucleoside-diphosphate-sugar epimerase